MHAFHLYRTALSEKTDYFYFAIVAVDRHDSQLCNHAEVKGDGENWWRRETETCGEEGRQSGVVKRGDRVVW
jgi:hypothetical protein